VLLPLLLLGLLVPAARADKCGGVLKAGWNGYPCCYCSGAYPCDSTCYWAYSYNWDYGGNCTWYAWQRRYNEGDPLPDHSWGNAKDWASSAINDGYTVVDYPQVGAVAVRVYGTWGHVAYVLSYDGSTVTVREQNCCYTSGTRNQTYSRSFFQYYILGSGSEVDGATFVSEGPPYDGDHLDCGESFTKTWTLRNSGTSTWTTDGSFRWKFDGGDQMGAPAYVTPSSAVAPGSTYTFSVPMVAPSTPGTYRGYWQMSHNGTDFGDRCWVEIVADPVNVDDATYVSEGPPYDGATLTCGETFTKTWTLQNSGTTTWTTDGSYRWKFDGGDQMSAPDYVLPDVSVAPGSNHTFAVTMTVPSTPGSYTGYWQMSHNGTDFGDRCWVQINAVAPEVDDAAFVSDGPPYDGDHLVVGESFTKTWTLQNTGTTTWTTDGSYQWKFDGGDQMSAPGYVLPDVSVAPGDEITFSVPMTVPSSPGSYTGYWQMSHNGTDFGDRCWVQIVADPAPVDDAAYVSESPPYDGAHLTVGEPFSKSWTLQNTGTTTWTTDGSYQWKFDGGDQMGGPAYVLPAAPVAPGEQATFTVDLVTPSTPGSYTGYWQLSHDGVDFGDRCWVQIVADEAAQPADRFDFPLGTASDAGGFHVHRGEDFLDPIYYHSYDGQHHWHPALDWIADWSGDPISDTTDPATLESLYRTYFTYTGETSGPWALSGDDLIDFYRIECYRQGPEAGNIIDTGTDLYPRVETNYGYGQPVYAVANGLVTAAGNYGTGWGNIVLIEHQAPAGQTFAVTGTSVVWTQYAHLQALNVVAGAAVSAGDLIGWIGDADGHYNATTGAFQRKEGSHLHFEIRQADLPADSWNVTDRDVTLANYTEPVTFICANRADDAQYDTWQTAFTASLNQTTTVELLRSGDQDWSWIELPTLITGSLVISLEDVPGHSDFAFDVYEDAAGAPGALIGSSSEQADGSERFELADTSPYDALFVLLQSVSGCGDATFGNAFTPTGASGPPSDGIHVLPLSAINAGGTGNAPAEKREDGTLALVDSLGPPAISRGSGAQPPPYLEDASLRLYSDLLPAALDTLAPSAPGAPVTSSPTSNPLPTWIWSPAEDEPTGSGIAMYIFYWSPVEGGEDYSATTTSTSYTHTSPLDPGVWFAKVVALDAEGNRSADSPAGSVEILNPTATPTITPSPTTPPSSTPGPTSTPSPAPSPALSPTPCPGGPGDLDGDGRITTSDALTCFQIALGSHIPTPCEEQCADADNDGQITTADALCIFLEALGVTNDCFPA
jgi:surface antigen/murein DD-endopeptidase MepM/ murein hydrolase activator NlpD